MPKINTSLHADHQLDQLAGQFEHWRQTRSHPSERIPQGLDRHRDYAERYIDYYFSDEDSTSVDPFPQDMLVYIWVNSNYSDVMTVKLDDIGEI